MTDIPPAAPTPETAGRPTPRPWCPPSQPGGRFEAVLHHLDPTYTQAHHEQRARFATPWLANAWLQHKTSVLTVPPSAPAAVCRAVVDDLADGTRPRPDIYDITGTAHEVMTALALTSTARGDRSPVTGYPETDTQLTFSLLEDYQRCCRQLRASTDELLSRHRALLRGYIGELLVSGAISWTSRRHARALLRGADLSMMLRPDGAFLAAIHQDTPPLRPEPPNPPASGALGVQNRFSSARHAREYLIHRLELDMAASRLNPESDIRAEVLDTRTETTVYSVTGPADTVCETLIQVTDFDGTLLIGIPEIDQRLLDSLVADYEHSAATLFELLPLGIDVPDPHSDPPWHRSLHQYQQLRAEITAMLDEPDLRARSEEVRARLDTADAATQLHLLTPSALTDQQRSRHGQQT
ncbi:hypothetical protein [Nocardia gipuzkoensis]|uniref:hypothetical protein n=1 Tax=Nocardia gipuzkoensis TaxID=2749991 RepID=UPI00237D9ECE|nr:hypothetical protein [Nocardia gipuzkoensis]MDE1672657.1 hypothetical protein [Nocardia gipuzkoensis]